MQTSPTRDDKEIYIEETKEDQIHQVKGGTQHIKTPSGNQIKSQKEEDWVVPVQEDRSTRTKMKDYKLQFDDLDYDQENLLHVVYYIFKGHFDIVVTINSNDPNEKAKGKVKMNI